jgi:hypothetical protein
MRKFLADSLWKKNFGPPTEDIKRRYSNLAINNVISHPFSGKGKKAGWICFHGFMPRHSQLSVHKPQPTFAAREKILH